MLKLLDIFSAKKTLFITGAGVVVLIVVLVAFLTHKSVKTFAVKYGTLTNTLELTGTYRTASQTQVVSPTNGILTEVLVKNTDRVEKGDKLFSVQSTATDGQKRAAYAAYLTAKSTLDADKSLMYSLQSAMYTAWKTYTDLAENATYQNSDGSPNNTNRVLTDFTTAQDDWLAAESQYKDQQGVVARDQAALSSAYLSYQETQDVTVTAPVSGQIVNLKKSPGDQVSAATATVPAPAILIIANLDNPKVEASVNEINIPRLHPGQPVEFTLDALPGKKFSGQIEYIDAVGVKNQGEVTYDVAMTLDHPDQQVKPGMTVNISVTTLKKDHVLTVPADAVIAKNGKNYVTKAGSKAPTEVKLGDSGLTEVEITGGLAEGDRIVLPE